ncbi:MAG: LPS export ABC transporter periplasmic protein LptC [Flavobacteriales bacterium]|nr:LPS export ABC transporter periplasmic protein LptC [Flavobacteriales bacterium]MBL0045754.1 LPS export ABC transporter periplasmic protein LptC [Flavobacteriales bacterium]
MRPFWWLIACVALCACKNDLDQLASIEMNADAPDRITTKAEYFYSDSGYVRNRLRAGRVEEFMTDGEQRTELSDGVELVFFDNAGRSGSTLNARRGSILPKTQRMEVFEQVVFTNSRGERMETEHLVWSQDSDRVYTDSPVKISRAQDIIYGQGLDANEDFSRYTIRKITGTLFVQPSDSATTPSN